MTLVEEHTSCGTSLDDDNNTIEIEHSRELTHQVIFYAPSGYEWSELIFIHGNDDLNSPLSLVPLGVSEERNAVIIDNDGIYFRIVTTGLGIISFYHINRNETFNDIITGFRMKLKKIPEGFFIISQDPQIKDLKSIKQ